MTEESRNVSAICRIFQNTGSDHSILTQKNASNSKRKPGASTSSNREKLIFSSNNQLHLATEIILVSA